MREKNKQNLPNKLKLWHDIQRNMSTLKILKGYSSKSFHTQMLVSCMHNSRDQWLGCPVGKNIMSCHHNLCSKLKVQKTVRYQQSSSNIVLVYTLCFKPWDINFSQFPPSLCNKFNNSLNSPFSWLLDLITYSNWATMQCSHHLYTSANTVIKCNIDMIHTHAEESKTLTSSFVNKMQREETILLKTSDGSIEVSCIYIQIYMKTKCFGLTYSDTIKYKMEKTEQKARK